MPSTGTWLKYTALARHSKLEQRTRDTAIDTDATVTETTVAADTAAADTAAKEETMEETTVVTPETTETETEEEEEEEMSETETTETTEEETEEEEETETDAPAADAKEKRPYFAIYYSPALLSAVDDARGTMSANAYLGNLLYAHFKVEQPVRKTRSKYANKEEAKAAAKKARDIKNAALKMLSEKYAAEMAEALAALKAAE